MAIIHTNFYTVSFPEKETMNVLVTFDKYKEQLFPQNASTIITNVKGVSIVDQPNPYDEIIQDIDQLYSLLKLEIPFRGKAYQELNVQEVKKLIEQTRQPIDQLYHLRSQMKDEIRENKDVLMVLEKIDQGTIDIDQLYGCSFITNRIGKIPTKNKEKIKYYRDYQFIYQEIGIAEDTTLIVYSSLNDEIGQIDNIFKGMNFEEIKLPEFVHGTFEDALIQVRQEIELMQGHLASFEMKIDLEKEKIQDTLDPYFKKMLYTKHLYDHSKYLVNFSNSMAIYTFSTYSMEKMKELFASIEGVRILSLPNDIYIERNIESPIIMENNRFIKPFENYISVQHCNQLDLALPCALLIYLAAFIFLGDIACGLGLLVLSKVFGKKKVAPGIMVLGISSLLSGLLQGSLGLQAVYPGIVTMMKFSLVSIGSFLGVCVIVKIVGMIISTVDYRRKERGLKHGYH